jgi:hypothetical protein
VQDASRIGVFGSFTGGHLAEFLAMRPHDPRYNVQPWQENPALDATVDYALACSPISSTIERPGDGAGYLGQVPRELLRSLGNLPRGQPARAPGSTRGDRSDASPDHAGGRDENRPLLPCKSFQVRPLGIAEVFGGIALVVLPAADVLLIALAIAVVATP